MDALQLASQKALVEGDHHCPLGAKDNLPAPVPKTTLQSRSLQRSEPLEERRGQIGVLAGRKRADEVQSGSIQGLERLDQVVTLVKYQRELSASAGKLLVPGVQFLVDGLGIGGSSEKFVFGRVLRARASPFRRPEQPLDGCSQVARLEPRALEALLAKQT
jgi:hypothetical protein